MNIKTNGKEIVAVVVPEWATEFRISIDGILQYTSEKHSAWHTCRFYPLFQNGRIIGSLDTLTEQQAAEYADRLMISVNIGGTMSGKEVFASNLRAHGLDTTSPILIIEKV